MKRNNRAVWLGAIALAAIIIISLVAAPSSKINNGSTYNHAPDGYAAWYAFMETQKIPIQRWQKPFSDITVEKKTTTLLLINSNQGASLLSEEMQKWVEKGNSLIILGVSEPATAAQFSTQHNSVFGNIKIDTSRRYKIKTYNDVILGDRFGAIIWQKNYGQGKIIFVTTPHFAANAYQDSPGNFKYLGDLVTKNKNQIFVDEYIHGYKDKDVKEKEGERDLLSYFAKTPLLIALLQLGVVLLTVTWAENRRFGKPATLETPVIDNSEAYVQALGGVLQKAESREFVVEMVGKEEQLQLQQVLGLSQVPLEHDILVKIWQEKIGKGRRELEEVLKLESKKGVISEQELINWLEKWHIIRLIRE